MSSLDYDDLFLHIYGCSQKLDGVNAMIPQTWWLGSPRPVTENAVCLREQIVAEVMMSGGSL